MNIRKTGSGTPVVLLHPALLESHYWEEVVARSPEGFESWLVDLPDHREDDPDFDLERTLAWLREELGAIDEPLVLVGASFGGYLTARIAADLPHLQRLVLQGAPAFLPRELTDAYLGLAEGIESGAVDRVEACRGAIAAAGGERLSSAWRERLLSSLLEWPAERVTRCLRRVVEAGRFPLETPIHAPTTILHAKDDASVPIELGRAFTTIAPNAELTEPESGGHCLALTEPELVARSVYGR